MSTRWTPQQREWLQAMGYRIWRLAGEEPAAERAGRSADVAPAAPDPTAPAAPVEPASATAPTGAERRLYRALLRATGQRTTRAAQALLRQLPVDLPALRGDPAAKREFWSRLRGLRKSSERR